MFIEHSYGLLCEMSIQIFDPFFIYCVIKVRAVSGLTPDQSEKSYNI